MEPADRLNHARHRLARLRNDLHAQLANLKSGSTIYKLTKGRMGGVMDAIQICDEEFLAQEQGEPTPPSSLVNHCAWASQMGDPAQLRHDQVVWLVGQRGGK